MRTYLNFKKLRRGDPRVYRSLTIGGAREPILRITRKSHWDSRRLDRPQFGRRQMARTCLRTQGPNSPQYSFEGILIKSQALIILSKGYWATSEVVK